MIFHDNWGKAVHRVQCIGWGIFTPGKPTMESFPKDYQATRLPDHLKEVLQNCSLSLLTSDVQYKSFSDCITATPK